MKEFNFTATKLSQFVIAGSLGNVVALMWRGTRRKNIQPWREDNEGVVVQDQNVQDIKAMLLSYK